MYLDLRGRKPESPKLPWHLDAGKDFTEGSGSQVFLSAVSLPGGISCSPSIRASIGFER